MVVLENGICVKDMHVVYSLAFIWGSLLYSSLTTERGIEPIGSIEECPSYSSPLGPTARPTSSSFYLSGPDVFRFTSLEAPVVF